MPLSIFISMLWIMYVQLLPTRLAPSIKRATLPFSVFFHLQNVSIIFLLIAANVNFGAKLLIYIGLTKHCTNYLHQNTIFIRAILHQNTIFYDGELHPNTILPTSFNNKRFLVFVGLPASEDIVNLSLQCCHFFKGLLFNTNHFFK